MPTDTHPAHDPAESAPLGLRTAAALGLGALMLVGVQALAFGWVRWPLSSSFASVPGDDLDFQLTQLEAVGRCWRAGLLPSWNPWTAGGVPLLANPEAPVFHPLGLAAAVWPAESVLRVSVWVHAWVALLGTGLLSAQLSLQVRQGAWTALLAGCLSMVGLASTDLVVSRVAAGHATMLQAAWIPVAVWLAGRRQAWLAALPIAVALYGGGPQCALFGALAVGLRLALAGLTHPSRWRDLLAVASLTAVVCLPRVLATAQGMVGADRFYYATPTHALSAQSLLEAIWRVALGGTVALRPEGGHNGLPALLLPVWPLLAARGSVALKHTVAVPCAMGVLFVLSFGDLFFVPLYRILHSFPMLEQLRVPDRLALAWVPLLCAVGGVGAVSLRVGRAGRVGGVALLVGFTGWAVSAHRVPWAVDPGRPVVTGESPLVLDAGLPLAAPVFVADRPQTNLLAVRTNRSCLGCWDATEVVADEDRAAGQYPLSAGASLVDWRPGRIVVQVEQPGVLSLPETARPGWQATGRGGFTLPLQSGPDGALRVVVSEPGWVTVRFVPPGLLAGTVLGALGLGLWLVVGVGWRRSRTRSGGAAHSDPANASLA